jgi:hypothetical protein
MMMQEYNSSAPMSTAIYATVTVADNEVTLHEEFQDADAETGMLREYMVHSLDGAIRVEACQWFGPRGKFVLIVSDVSEEDAVLAAHLAAALLEEKVRS